ncbi:MAG: NAD(P)/FAD-dependent oxidoreductase [Eubacteriales bacterium]
MYDVIIIGAGVTGSACARELSKYKLKICVLEKDEDVCCGTSKANSGIIHAGYDAKHGSLMAEMNVKGNEMMAELAEELDIPWIQNGSIVVAKHSDSMDKLYELYENGVLNGVKDLEIITDKERIFQMEPNLDQETEAVLYAPTAGIVCPFELNLALSEHAKINGVEFVFNIPVLGISRKNSGATKDGVSWIVETDKDMMETKYIVNSAGVHADMFHNMVSTDKINIIPRRGEYLLLDKEAGSHVQHTIFTLPNEYGKGILITPTVHGNLLVGPTANDIEDKDDTATSRAGIETIIEKSTQKGIANIKGLPLQKVITSFAGIRAHEEGHEFIIEELEDAKGFIDCAGIESPGLTSCPAIGCKVADIISSKLELEKKEDYIATRKGLTRVATMEREAWKSLIQNDASYANIICRCEMISEGEILEAIHRPLGAKSLDGIKRRVRASAGRCQGGFCSPKIMEILSRELEVDIACITKSGGESHLIVGKNKE